MRFLHISDLHLGFSLNGVSLLEEQEYALTQVRQIVHQYNIDGIIIAGDVFDRAVTNADALALYDRFLTALRREDKVSVFMIAGNHDGGARLAQLSEILSSAEIHISGMLSRRPDPIQFGDAEIWLIPYFHSEQVRLLYPEQEIHSAHDAMSVLLKDIGERRSSQKKSIVVAHCFVNGAKISESDMGARLGGASLIGADVFNGVDYTALGHLHEMQSPADRVWYSGSIFPYSFSERNKFAIIYDSAEDTVTPVPLQAQRMLRTLEGTYDEVLRHAEQEKNADDYMRIILTDRSVGIETLERFRRIYPRLLALLAVSEAYGSSNTLTNEELRSIAPEELLLRFCKETADYEPQQDEIDAFMEALRTVQGEGELQ